MVFFNQFPVFEANQVLRHDHLNDVVNYLEEQSRLTRTKTVGIGIVCGYRMAFDQAPDGNGVLRDALLVSEGVGITSKGFLASTTAQTFTGYKPYTIKEEFSSLEKDIRDKEPYTDKVRLYRELAEVYSFFKDGPNDLLELFELVPDVAADEDADILSSDFLQDKVLILYLKQDLQSLKNCDTNDCNDQGSRLEMNFIFLLADKNVAEEIKTREKDTEEEGKRPLHNEDHEKYNLPGEEYLTLPRIDVFNNPPVLFEDLVDQYAIHVAAVIPYLKTAVLDSLKAYKYLLDQIYPDNAGAQFQQRFNQLLQAVQAAGNAGSIAIQYFYDFLASLIDAYLEFRNRAFIHDALCNAGPDHFPKHLFLGSLTDIDKDLSEEFLVRSPFLSTGNGFFPVEGPQVPFRHGFIPAPDLQKQEALKEELWTLHYRIFSMLSAFAPNQAVNMKDGIKVVPGRSKLHPLSKRAIPAYLPVTGNANNTADGLLRLWSYEKTVRNQLALVPSYYRINNNNHPLQYRQGDEDFYRIEGHVGRELSPVLEKLYQERRRLGLDFSIEVVLFSDTPGGPGVGQRVTLFSEFVKRHPGLEHQGGVPRGGTLVVAYRLIKGSYQVVADFALPYNCCTSGSQGWILQQCVYKWISSSKYLRNIGRPKKGFPIPQRSYNLVITKYEIEGSSLLKGGPVTVRVPMKVLKKSGMRAIVDALNAAFPTGLVFDTVREEDRIAIKKYAGQHFELVIREGINADSYLFNEKGRIKIGDIKGDFYKEAVCSFIPPPYDPVNYELLHQSLDKNREYSLAPLTNLDWKKWNNILEGRLITSLDDNRLQPISKSLAAIREAVLSVVPRARVFLVGSWVDGSWVSDVAANNPPEMVKIREKLLGKTGWSDIDVLISLPNYQAGTEDAVRAVVRDYYGNYKANVTFGNLEAGMPALEIKGRV
ncbi:MAG: hypothetical protein H6563_08390 [Lewinellaceae bacterium]|nr:hypothetical protein [Lewinellaceae bacterium]